MTIIISNDYYSTGDWLLAVDGANGYAWRDALVTVNGESVSPLWAPSYSWSLMAKDKADAASASNDTAVAAAAAAAVSAGIYRRGHGHRASGDRHHQGERGGGQCGGGIGLGGCSFPSILDGRGHGYAYLVSLPHAYKL
jgi:hypothetical protein